MDYGQRPPAISPGFGNPVEKLAIACRNLLEKTPITPHYDAILIDEGQDLIIDNADYLFEGKKQPIYWLAYQAVRSFDPDDPQAKRLIWAYDEYQSMSSMKIPTAKESIRG